ncbi:cellulose synthase 1 [Actinidia rufa]|uniref:Cellulose synthase 1 n=1 Tax=Actinidia rufa TaxID=165716 RepID=A0A7J0GID5_9ERIC|nr:cellulose synthase 1 [Actinidia rufa]
MKREYEEFKVRVNALVAKAQKAPEVGWTMQDGTPWPGNNVRDHAGMIQITLLRSMPEIATLLTVVPFGPCMCHVITNFQLILPPHKRRVIATWTDGENLVSMSENKLEKKFGQCPLLVPSTLLQNGGALKGASAANLLKEAIHVISCGYEEKTEWGKEVLRWALGSIEIFLSRHCPLWYGYGSGLKWLERLSYINATIYPWTSIPLLAYCTLLAVCLLTGKFITLENEQPRAKPEHMLALLG